MMLVCSVVAKSSRTHLLPVKKSADVHEINSAEFPFRMVFIEFYRLFCCLARLQVSFILGFCPFLCVYRKFFVQDYLYFAGNALL